METKREQKATVCIDFKTKLELNTPQVYPYYAQRIKQAPRKPEENSCGWYTQSKLRGTKPKQHYSHSHIGKRHQ